jgi:two-component system chemotaxis response regulator CheY
MADQDSHELSDVLETLENLEESLMEYEDLLKEDQTDDSLIHFIFRYAHNLKSSLGMIHKQHCSNLIHAVESEFDLIRSGKAAATTEVIDKTFTAIDVIKDNLYREEEAAEDLQALQEEIEQLQQEAEEAEGEEYAQVNYPLSQEAHQKITTAEQQGYRIYQVEKFITSDIDKESFENLPIYEDIQDVGFHVYTHPSFENIDTKSDEAIVKILFASGKDPEELFYEIFDPFRPVDGESVKGGSARAQKTVPGAQYKEILEKKKAEVQASAKQPGEFLILIVEDDFVTRHLEVSMLGEYGNCEVAVNGSEAVAAFERHLAENDPYDLILLDILIPEMDGHEVLQQIRESEEEQGIVGFERTRVIVVSNLNDMDTISRSFRRQSDSYIIKPITKAKIAREMKRVGLIT